MPISCSHVPIGLNNSDPLSVLPEDISLRVLFGPDEDHKNLLKTRMSEMKSGKFLHFKMLGGINDLFVGMQKMTEALDAVNKMNNAIEKMNTSIEELKTENKELRMECKELRMENKELRMENQKMNTSIETLTKRHEKDIAKLSKELSEEKRCRGEELEAIRKVCWISVTR